MSPPLPTKPARGRPRSLQARDAVLDAARSLVEQGGYPAATIEAVAARSGVAKTTIYRWWPHRPALVVDLLAQLADTVAPPPTAGDDPLAALRTEFRLVAEASARVPGRLLVSLLGEAQNDPDVHRALMSRIFTPRRQATARVVRQAQAAGLIRGDVPPLLVVDLLFGPLFYRQYIRRMPCSRAFVKQAFEQVLDGLRPGGQSRR